MNRGALSVEYMPVMNGDLRLADMHAIRDFIKQESLSPSW
jgi:hypothetical protein